MLASYPITPASELLHELSRHAKFGVSTIQAEDEIAAAGMALGAAFGGRLGVTATSGPGMDLKAETIGLAVALELPMIIVDVQRAGPSTGMPTKTEQSDLLMALYGRHGESPLPVIAPSTPGDCFDVAFEAARIAIRYRTPVILLSDTFLASSSEPWLIPDVADLPEIDPGFAVADGELGPEEFLPYARDERLARPWAMPGTPGLQHRIGGLEKADGTGNISYDAANHARMTELRAAKVAGIADEIPPLVVDAEPDARLLVLGWGSSEGAIRAGVRRARLAGHKVASAHLRHLNPLPANTGDVLRSFDRVLVPEMNTGQLAQVLRAKFLVDVESFSQGPGPADLRRRDRATDRGAAMSAVTHKGNGNGGAPEALTKADFQSDQETRWCPGCGDYAVLSAVQQFMPELGIPPEKIVFITGIGCAGRFAYYMDTYGMHGIHGRAPALATGLATAREDLSIWVVTGDGDSLSIGGNHLIHALRRNVPVKILLFNNQIYGLTKGQASPTSELGKITKSTPFGVADHPFNPVALALGAEATFVARTIDRDRRHLTDVLRAAAEHEGAALVEIYQNCPVFNDGAFAALTEKEVKDANQIRLEAGEPIRFGVSDERGVARGADGGLSRSSPSTRSARTRCSSTIPRAWTRGWRSRWRGWPRTRPARRRSASSGTSSGRCTGGRRAWRPSRRRPSSSGSCCSAATPGPSRKRHRHTPRITTRRGRHRRTWRVTARRGGRMLGSKRPRRDPPRAPCRPLSLMAGIGRFQSATWPSAGSSGSSAATQSSSPPTMLWASKPAPRRASAAIAERAPLRQ